MAIILSFTLHKNFNEVDRAHLQKLGHYTIDDFTPNSGTGFFFIVA